MISCRTIIGTAVIEIEKGIGLGQVHQVLVDEGVLLTFVVKANQGGEPYALLPGSNIHGIGDFAAMVKSAAALQPIDETGLATLVEQQGAIFDEMVITVDGNKIGRVVDYHIDPQNEIGFLVVNPENEGTEIQIPKSQILMIGKEYIILNEATGLGTAEAGQSAPAMETPVLKAAEPVVVEPVEVPVVSLEEVAEKVVEPVAPVEEELDRDAIFAQFDAAALMAKKHEEVEAAKVETSASLDDLSKSVAATEPVAPVEAPAPATSLEELAVEATPEEEVSKGSMSLEEAFAVATPASQAVAEEAVATDEAETRSEGRVIPLTISSSEEGNNFLNEQKRLLVGKRLQKDLIGPDGNVILLADEVVTDGTIDLLRRIDRRLLVRLAGCVI